MKRGIFIVGLAFVITLAVIFGFRASADAMAVVIGVMLGVAAGIPTTLLVVFIMTRQTNRLDKSTQQPPQPPVFVINAGDKQPYNPSPPALPAPYASNQGGRKWTVIGDTDID